MVSAASKIIKVQKIQESKKFHVLEEMTNVSALTEKRNL